MQTFVNSILRFSTVICWNRYFQPLMRYINYWKRYSCAPNDPISHSCYLVFVRFDCTLPNTPSTN